MSDARERLEREVRGVADVLRQPCVSNAPRQIAYDARHHAVYVLACLRLLLPGRPLDRLRDELAAVLEEVER